MAHTPTQTMMRALNSAAEAIWLRTHQQWPNVSIDVVPEVGSTNTALMTVARSGDLNAPRVMLTASQTAGRGRLGKPWQTRVGDALTFSVALPWPGSLPLLGLSLATGVAIAQTLRTTKGLNNGVAPRIKWPNDIWIDDHKLAGILVEVCGQDAQRCVVLGVGINITPPDGVLSHNGVVPTGLAQHLQADAALDISEVVASCVAALAAMLGQFEQHGFAPFVPSFEALDALKGRALHLSDGTQGIGIGVDSHGGLRLQSDSGDIQTIISQEVSVRLCVSS
ncbi:biotin--[acetyl-CoA-carboxylase] ligase [Comamonadaceae bacterium M7527]|nr:biotin--[acetyl-CoA-carboxylase] ligase [Comamonadaceae bacterium M7527]